MVQEADREADLPAQQPAPRQAARVPAPHVDARRSCRPAEPPAQGSPPAVRLIWRVRDRQTFVELRRSRQRVRCDTLMVARVAPRTGSSEPPRVAFAIGRKLGGAVARNRLRRRLRAAFTLAAADGRVPAGSYLATALPAAMAAPFSQLSDDVTTAMSMMGHEAGGRA